MRMLMGVVAMIVSDLDTGKGILDKEPQGAEDLGVCDMQHERTGLSLGLP